jgi:hypothetical protein
MLTSKINSLNLKIEVKGNIGEGGKDYPKTFCRYLTTILANEELPTPNSFNLDIGDENYIGNSAIIEVRRNIDNSLAVLNIATYTIPAKSGDDFYRVSTCDVTVSLTNAEDNENDCFFSTGNNTLQIFKKCADKTLNLKFNFSSSIAANMDFSLELIVPPLYDSIPL